MTYKWLITWYSNWRRNSFYNGYRHLVKSPILIRSSVQPCISTNLGNSGQMSGNGTLYSCYPWIRVLFGWGIMINLSNFFMICSHSSIHVAHPLVFDASGMHLILVSVLSWRIESEKCLILIVCLSHIHDTRKVSLYIYSYSHEQ